MKKEENKSRSVIIFKNDAALGRQRMTIQEAKLLRIAVAFAKQGDKDFFEREIDRKSVAKILNINAKVASAELKKISTRLVRRTLDFKDEKGNWEYYPWFQKIAYKDGVLSFRLNDQIKPYILQLEGYFLRYELDTAISFKSIYALRIYEIIKTLYGSCKKSKTTFRLTIEELREITDTEDKFERFSSFRAKVLDVATDEITAYSDIALSYDTEKFGRSISSIIFYLTEKNKIKQLEAPDPEPAAPTDPIPGQVDLADIYKVKELLDYKAIPCTIEQAEQLFLAYNSEISEQFLNNLDYVSKNKKIRNHVAYLLKISKDHVAQEPETIPTDSPEPKRKPRKTKVETIEPMSESREQAYRDMEVDFAEDLWPDLAVEE
ncbi:Initiator Replication protein [anaerobic digester metagenome]